MPDKNWREFMALGHAARKSGRVDEATGHYRTALALAPDNAETNSAYGLMLLETNRMQEAESLLKRAVALDPSLPAARINLAELLARQDDIAGAIRVMAALADETPQHAWIWEKLGELQVRAHQFPSASASFRRAAERRQDDPSLLFKWARATFDSGSPAEAEAILDKAARVAPGHEAILRLYTEIYEANSDWDRLERTAQSWLRVHPQNPLPWRIAAKGQWETGYLKQAMQSYRAFLDRGGRTAPNLATYGRLCLKALAYDDAARALDEAEQLDAACGHMLSAKAALSMFQGRFDDALAYARRALVIDPEDIAAFKVLVQVSGGRVTPDEFLRLAHLSENGGAHVDNRIAGSFALADCLDAQGDFDAAFVAYERANALSVVRGRQDALSYDRADRERQTDRVISTFRSVAPEVHTRVQPVPIFIVGMPRSGTTLIESIVGAHSQVFACGERQEMRSIMQEFVASGPHQHTSGIAEGVKQAWREAFWRELPDLRGATAVTDKNPWNFDALGLIFELFPEARVVHVRRDPVETGLSIFRNEFSKFVSFANRLEDIGHYYGQYARLMAHWQQVLRDRFMTIQYEELIGDFARVAPELVRFCGLEWEDACLQFSTSNRIIATMSTVQARQPPSAIKGRAARYARHLAPLIASLRKADVDLQTGAFAPGSAPVQPGGHELR